MFDWAFDSLNRRIRKAEREWRAANMAAREYAYGPWQRVVVPLSVRPKKWLLLYAALLAVFSAVLWLCLRFESDAFLFAVLDHKFATISAYEFATSHTFAVELTYFTTIWMVQATLAGLVYPIVISFVAILLQRQYNAKATLHIYLADAAAIPAGLGALTLVGIMGAQYLCLPYVPDAVAPLWTALDTISLLVNLALMVYFLYRTIEFIRPDRRTRIMRSYALNIAWPTELRRHLVEPFFATALVDMGALARNEFGNNCAIVFSPWRPDAERVRVTKKLPRTAVWSDVWLRCLRLAVASWCKLPGATAPFGPDRRPTMAFSVHPNQVFSNEVTLCHVENNAAPTSLGKKVMRCAFIFRTGDEILDGTTAGDMLNDLRAEVALALTARGDATIRDRLSELNELYTLLIRASVACKDGVWQNHATLSDSSKGASIFGRVPLYQVWGATLRDAFRSTSQVLDVNAGAVCSAMGVARRCSFVLLKESQSNEISAYGLSLLPSIFRGIQMWWVGAIERHGIVDHTACNPAVLGPPFSGHYGDALGSFVGEWEALRDWDIVESRGGFLEWDTLRSAGVALENHLQHTIGMLFEAVRNGDREGAEWLADTLIKWFGKLRTRTGTVHHIPGNAELTWQLTEHTWSDLKDIIAQTVDTPGPGYDDAGLQEAVFWSCLENYWIDVCYVTAAALASIGRDCDCDNALALRLIKALVGMKSLREGNAANGGRPLNEVQAVFDSILRSYRWDAVGARYHNRLMRLVAETKEPIQEPKVPGRVYVTSDGNTFRAWEDGVLFVALLAARAGSSIPVSDAGRFHEWVRREVRQAKDAAGEMKKMIERLKSVDMDSWKSAFDCVQDDGKEKDFGQAKKKLEDVLAWAVNEVEEAERVVVSAAGISQETLNEIEEWASQSEVFSQPAVVCPLPFFKVWYSDAERSVAFAGSDVRTVAISYPKNLLISKPTEARAVNEKEWFGTVVRDYVLMEVWRTLRGAWDVMEVEANSPDLYWMRLSEFARECVGKGCQAILFVGNPAFPGWLLKWTYAAAYPDMPKPQDFVFWRNPLFSVEGNKNGYLGNFGDVAAFHAPQLGRESVLVAQEALKAVTFSRNARGHFVDVTWTPDVQNELVGNLTLSWLVKVEVEPGKAFSLIYD